MDYVQALNESSVWQYTMMSFIQSMIDQGLISQMEGENLIDILLERMGDWAGIGYTGGAISDLSPNPSPYAPNSFDDRMIFANKDEILLNRDISNHFRDELLYLNKFGELPLWSSLFIQERFIPNFDIADYKNNLNKNLIDSKSNKSTYQLIEKENNSNNKIEVLIKNENEKKQKNTKNINRPIIFNFNGRKSNLKLTKEEVVVMERIADRIANKNIKEPLSEFWEN